MQKKVYNNSYKQEFKYTHINHKIPKRNNK